MCDELIFDCTCVDTVFLCQSVLTESTNSCIYEKISVSTGALIVKFDGNTKNSINLNQATAILLKQKNEQERTKQTKDTQKANYKTCHEYMY